MTKTDSDCLPPETVLLESVKKNDLETIRTLINFNENLLTYKYPLTSKDILSTACNENGVDAKTIQTLIDLGAKTTGNSDWKPLHLAVKNSDSSILRVIIKNLPSEHINDTHYENTALHSLVISTPIKNNEKQFCEHVKLLLQAGINVNQSDYKNLSAIYLAAKNNYKNVVKTILETSVCPVDLDNHQEHNKSARDLIKEKQLYSGPLPEPINQKPEDKVFSLLKQKKEDEFLKYFDASFQPNPSDFVKLDDGTATLLQYSCEKGLPKVVKYLLDRGANVNKVIGNCNRTPLHLATTYGFYEIVNMLFNTKEEFQISSDTLCDVIKHSDNPKHDKIDHEKCSQIMLDKLKPKDIVNVKDEGSNTAIHYSLRYASEDTTLKLLALGASLACKNKFGKMPIEDMNPELLEQHLNNCLKFDINRNKKDDFKVVFDYETLMPPRCAKDDPENSRKRKKLAETEVINYMSKAPQLRALLLHPVIVSFLILKWQRIRPLFLINLLFYLIFGASLVTYIFTYYANFASEASSSDFWVVLSKITLNLTLWILTLREVFQIVVFSKNYFLNFENYVEIILIVITAMILYLNSPIDTRRQLASVAILMVAFEMVLMVGQHPKFSTNVEMLKRVSVNYFIFLIWYSLLIVAFALSFYILFAKSALPEQESDAAETEEEDLFMGPAKSLFKTIIMLTGEFDAGSIDFRTYPITSKLVFIFFVFMIPIILLNLLNGLAVSDTQTIKNEAELVGHIARAQHIYSVESMVLGNIASKFKFLGRRIRLFESDKCEITVLPNDQGRIYCESAESFKRTSNLIASCLKKCSYTYLDQEKVKNINMIVKMRRENTNVPNVDIVARITKLEDLLQQLIENKS